MSTLSLRKPVALGTVALSVAVLGVSGPVAAATQTGGGPVTHLTSLLDDSAAWAAVKTAEESGYAVSAKLAASCGATQ